MQHSVHRTLFMETGLRESACFSCSRRLSGMSAKRSPDNFHRPPIQRIGSSAFLFPAGGKQCFNVPLYFRVSGKLLFKSLLYFRTCVGGIRLCISQQTLNRRDSNTPEWNFSDIAGFLPLSVPCLQCLLFPHAAQQVPPAASGSSPFRE